MAGQVGTTSFTPTAQGHEELYPCSLHSWQCPREGVWYLPPSQVGTQAITEHILNQAWGLGSGGVRICLCHWEQALRLALGPLLCIHDLLDSHLPYSGPEK